MGLSASDSATTGMKPIDFETSKLFLNFDIDNKNK